MRKRPICKKCGGFRDVCGCLMESLAENRKGQKDIFRKQRMEEELREDVAYISSWLGLPEAPKPVTKEEVMRWMKERCKSRRGKEDSSSVAGLFRDFQRWREGPAEMDLFVTCVINCGAKVGRDMWISGVILAEDWASLKTEKQA